jgi:hypothetical protein
MQFPTPHLEKLNKTLANDKLPPEDAERIKHAIERYREWINTISKITGEPDYMLHEMVRLLSEYKNYIDLDVIFDSQKDFLYRQKGQLKLDNSILEEFLPWLVRPPLVQDLWAGVDVGGRKCFSAINFSSSINRPEYGGGMRIRSKDQDFAISRQVFVRTSYSSEFGRYEQDQMFIAHVAAEIKTNLDKTMFQEACATAHDVKSAVAGSKYYLICEWLDMTPLSTGATDIDEVLLLRKSKRINSNVRSNFAPSEGRRRHRDMFETYLMDNPFRTEVFRRFLDHIKVLLKEQDPVEEDVLSIGFF